MDIFTTPSLSPSASRLFFIYICIFIKNKDGFRECISKNISPERGKFFSPGQRPGDMITVIFEALKGRNMIIEI